MGFRVDVALFFKVFKGSFICFAFCFTASFAVIAGELEGSWRAGGQQEGLQYNGEAAA